MGEFPSGQRGQTVNLLAMPSVVRIHLPPPELYLKKYSFFFALTKKWRVLHLKSPEKKDAISDMTLAATLYKTILGHTHLTL